MPEQRERDTGPRPDRRSRLTFRIAGAIAMACGGLVALGTLTIARADPDAGIVLGVSILVFMAGLWSWLGSAKPPAPALRGDDVPPPRTDPVQGRWLEASMNTVEAAHDGDCPFCKAEVRQDATVCTACSAEKGFVNDGPGAASRVCRAVGWIIGFLCAPAGCVVLIVTFGPRGGDGRLALIWLCALALALFLELGLSRQLKEKHETRTAREAWGR